MDRTKYLEPLNVGIKYQKLSYISDVCNIFFTKRSLSVGMLGFYS